MVCSIFKVIYRVSHIILDYHQALTPKYAHIILENPSIFCKKTFIKTFLRFLKMIHCFQIFLLVPKVTIFNYTRSNTMWDTLYLCMWDGMWDTLYLCMWDGMWDTLYLCMHYNENVLKCKILTFSHRIIVH